MRVRLPLYAKISIWFLLNLLAVAAVFALLFNAQFKLNLDWLLAAGARDRLEAVRNLIVGDLEMSAPEDWEDVMSRYSEAHRVRFALFDEDADPLVGGIRELPAEVRDRIAARGPFPGGPRRFGEMLPVPAPGTDDRRAANEDRPRRRRAGPPLRAIMRTSDPTQYWLLASARLDNPLAGDPMRVVLVARSNSMSGGGLIFNPKPWLALGLGAVIFSLLFWLPLVRGITKSVGQMTHATRQIANGRFDVRVNTRRRDELGSLAAAINQMAGRLDGFVTGQKRFLGDIAHELCSPLARLQMALGILEQRAPGDRVKDVQSATEKAEQIASLVGELLSFSKASFGASAVQLRPVRVREIVDEAVRRESTDSSDIRVHVDDELVVAADPELLLRSVANLLRNAVHHAAQAGPITVRAARDGDEIAITVSDSGPGVPEPELPKIFDAFYRLDASRARQTGGSGLGLAIVKSCVESCCGSVLARNQQPHGLEVELRLKRAAEKTPALSIA